MLLEQLGSEARGEKKKLLAASLVVRGSECWPGGRSVTLQFRIREQDAPRAEYRISMPGL